MNWTASTPNCSVRPASVSSVAGDTPTYYRGRLANTIVAVIAGLTALHFLVELIHQLGSSGASSFDKAYDAIFVIAFLIPALRFPRNGVQVSDAKIVIRNILRTHVLQWETVERFEVSGASFTRTGVAVLKDGSRIRMTGIRSGLVDHFAQNTVAALNARLGRRT